MSGIETAIFTLGTAVAKTACGVWFGDHKIVNTAVVGVIDLAAQRLTSARERRRFQRFWEQTADLVAERVEPLLEHEFRRLPEHDRLAAVDAVRSTFEIAALTEAQLFAEDLDAGYLDRYLRGQDPDRVVVAGLSSDGEPLYDLLLRECCAYAIELVGTLPNASVSGLAEVLRRERRLLDDMRTVLARLPARRGATDFARDYSQLVANVHDRVELFGATLAESSRRYPLSVAYLSLTVSGEFPLRQPFDRPLERGFDTRPRTTVVAARVEEVLASTSRLLVRGEAGLGKTTLLQWIAVQCARGSLPDQLADWSGTVPYLVALRRHADGDLPAPERFAAEAGRHIAAEMPPGWVHEQLRSGRAVVLVDGVDELPERRRGEVRRWLRELVIAFPAARYVVTSRPAAVPADWLGGEDFDVADLEPMNQADVPTFIHRWHQAMREQSDTDLQRAELTGYEQQLLGALAGRRHLRSLAKHPLLCALLCALYQDRRGQLPGSRMELYEVALQMLLERRDQERQVERELALTRTDQTLILRDIAYWLIRNGWTSAPAERVRERIAAKLTGMTQVDAGADEVYRLLLERSGLLREPVAGQTDFVHRTFQEYLAAAEAVATDDIGALVANAWTDLWGDMVVMAAGYATARQRAELIHGLLDRATHAGQRLGDSLRLLAVACLETSPELPPDLRHEVERAAQTLLPPRTMAAAQALAKGAGALVLDLLARTEPRSATEVAATIRVLADIGDPVAVPMLARFGTDARKPVVRELLRAWPRFDPEQYAQTVLAHHPLDNGRLEIADRRMIPALRHLTKLNWLSFRPLARGARVHRGPSPVIDPGFVRDLPGLRTLELGALLTDLVPLAGTGLERLLQLFWIVGEDPHPLSLAPLAEAGRLTELTIWGASVTEIPALHQLDCLKKLSLHRVGTAEALAELVPLSDLEGLGVGGIPDLRSLGALEFLNNPNSISVFDCSSLSDVSAVGRWSETLESVQLERCPAVELAPLQGAELLGHLDLWGSGALDLTPIAGLPRLSSVMLGDGPVPDLHPLRESPALATLYVLGAAELDLSPLAGRGHLQVIVSRPTTVHGAERLGPGSRVVQR